MVNREATRISGAALLWVGVAAVSDLNKGAPTRASTVGARYPASPQHCVMSAAAWAVSRMRRPWIDFAARIENAYSRSAESSVLDA